MELKQLRDDIDALDQQLLSLFIQRMAVAEQVALYKRNTGAPIRHPEREAEIIQWARSRAGSELADSAQGFMEALIGLSCARQEQILSSSNE